MKVGVLQIDQHFLNLSSQSISTLLSWCDPVTRFAPQRLFVFLRANEAPPRVTTSLFEGICKVYNQAFRHNPDLDVRVCLANLKPASFNQAIERRVVTADVVFRDDQARLDPMFQIRPSAHVSGLVVTNGMLHELIDAKDQQRAPEEDWASYDNVVIGGTFDHLHAGHKLLLSNAILRCNRKLTIGLTVQEMLKKKRLADLIQPIEERHRVLHEFCTAVDPSLEYNIVPISDPFGPSIVDPDLEAIVASEETLDGANAVNLERHKKNLRPLRVHTFPVNDVVVVESDIGENSGLRTISSSWCRHRLLGRVLKPPMRQVYLIGLTGGTGSGKSRIGSYLAAKPGVLVIDCDKIAHEAYRKGTTLHGRLIEEYGKEIVDTESGEIARKALGTIVFSSPVAREKLNRLVWPEVMKYCLSKIEEAAPEVAVIDAALLLEAGWGSSLNEIWVVFVPEDEAVNRIMERDEISEEYARARIRSQMSNRDRINQANIAFCSSWAFDVTNAQVDRAWTELRQRLSRGRGQDLLSLHPD
ncbi:Bifunctional coenzyme A synthase [Hypsibius exemplaris]|uniref:Bifunctional coenzyme A synthase n=1 Tax=Hypsibius exemplaris TaxID=2072580 RepID=A0A1W0WUR5_HYPEX|nr:Bifunctional coenzyme A synthase [Hypsibius exemplaris]